MDFILFCPAVYIYLSAKFSSNRIPSKKLSESSITNDKLIDSKCSVFCFLYCQAPVNFLILKNFPDNQWFNHKTPKNSALQWKIKTKILSSHDKIKIHPNCPFLSSLVRLYCDCNPFYAWFSMINPAGLLDTNMSAFISISKITEAILW